MHLISHRLCNNSNRHVCVRETACVWCVWRHDERKRKWDTARQHTHKEFNQQSASTFPNIMYSTALLPCFSLCCLTTPWKQEQFCCFSHPPPPPAILCNLNQVNKENNTSSVRRHLTRPPFTTLETKQARPTATDAIATSNGAPTPSVSKPLSSIHPLFTSHVSTESHPRKTSSVRNCRALLVGFASE